MVRAKRATAAALGVMIIGLVALHGPARADGSQLYVALGDSYSSGVGAPPYDGTSCARSPYSYAPQYATYRASILDMLACSGATTEDVRQRQIPLIPVEATRVSITVGGDDLGFSKGLMICLTGTAEECRQAVDAANAYIATVLAGKLDAVYSAIRQQAPDAWLAVLGYPLLFADGTHCVMAAERQTWINEVATKLNGVISRRAQVNGAVFGDAQRWFDGHGLCGPDPWINGPQLPDTAFHPNRDGYSQGYLSVLKYIGVS